MQCMHTSHQMVQAYVELHGELRGDCVGGGAV